MTVGLEVRAKGLTDPSEVSLCPESGGYNAQVVGGGSVIREVEKSTTLIRVLFS